MAVKSFVDTKPDALKIVLDEVKKVSEWAKNNSTELLAFNVCFYRSELAF
ncbi:hypothetical protein ANSO36C_06690 [Nostoc cf. commune SO-36]|uniref:Uncharacterized protein n=1 Tax=Nostoc cf. commune SO-36 TaxID=449208 RepID=A0ABM7YW68_NOSCO|nr:hypothetical protein [Nostoc commune]BDI14867.1 hypothetical protein ANSO36C_06690 [Nostoc cf. commune SO-36]